MPQSHNPPEIFNRQRLRAHRARGAAKFASHDFLHYRAMEDIVDRLETVKRSFPKSLFYGVGDLKKLITPACKVEEIIHGDSVCDRLPNQSNATTLIYDEEKQPLASASFDLIVSLLTLHNTNDLIGALAQYRQALKPDGLFIAALFGGSTLSLLRQTLMSAELEETGGAATRIHPFADVKDIGNAVSRAGFTLPVTDVDTVKVDYKDPISIIQDLRAMGEINALARKPNPLPRQSFANAMTSMQNKTQIFEIIYCTAWAPHPKQPKPAKPGSAKRASKTNQELYKKAKD